VRSQLQDAADAAARSAITGLGSSVQQAQNNAVSIASQNNADGSPVVLNTNTDIEFGTWTAATQTFTVLSGSAASAANAVRITARRTTSTNNPVSLAFGAFVGMPTANAHAVAIAGATGGYGLVGLTGITLKGNSSVSYWSPTGTTSQHGSIASNGNINLNGSSYIQGDARPGAGCSVTCSGSASVTGSTQPLPSPLNYPNASAGSYATSNNDSNASPYWNGNDFNLGGSSSLTLPGGYYYFDNFTVAPLATLTFSGPAVVYVTGWINIPGTINTASNLPKNLQIQVIGSANVSIGNQTALYADIYAPQSAVTLSGGGDIYGSVLGYSINMTGSSGIHYDLALPGGWNVTTVH
ncbi:MAG TPA: TadG family pilus assembly protein, partial [Tepidisphaeraceae bacterium]|nr:TadG family pilus assembly protein [Tepidisphaeraceae bacterium]